MTTPGTLGTTLELRDGDLVISDGRFEMVDGIDCLEQSLTLRIGTPYGTDRVNVAYGLDVTDAFTGSHGLAIVKQLVRMSLVRTLAGDPRVDEVREVIFADDPDFAELTGVVPSAADRHNRRWQAAVTVHTIDSLTTTLLVDVEV